MGGNRALHAVTPAGRVRVLFRGTGALTVADVSRDGRLLLAHSLNRIGLAALAPGDRSERDLSWFDWSLMADLSQDGRTVLFSESGEGGGAGYSAFLRATDGSPAVRLGEGSADSLSPDGKRALCIVHPTTDQQIAIYPTGPGEAKVLSFPNLRARRAEWLPDGRHFLMAALETGHGLRVYLVDSEGGNPKPVTPEGLGGAFRTYDAKHFFGRGPERKYVLFPVEGVTARRWPGSSRATWSSVRAIGLASSTCAAGPICRPTSSSWTSRPGARRSGKTWHRQT